MANRTQKAVRPDAMSATACRSDREVNMEAIPVILRDCPQWVAWRLEHRDGKSTKLPINAKTGGNASTTKPITWTVFEEAWEFATKMHAVGGVGFVFTPEAGIVGIDLDHCLSKHTGELAPWAQEIVTTMNSYTEHSPSGEGLHILVRGTLPDGVRNKKQMPDGGAIEIYDRERYFTVTGHHLAGTPTAIEERSEQLSALCRKVFGETGKTVEDTEQQKNAPAELTVNELDERLKAAMGQDPVLKKLWHGITADYNDDHSAADLALCNKLVNIYGRDAKVIDEVFRQSGLMRDKWEREDYRQWTILRAMDRNTTVDAIKKRKPGRSSIKPSLKDIVRVLESYPELQGSFWYDEFLQRGLTGNPPREWTDHDDLEMAVKIQGLYGFAEATVETIRMAIATVMGHRRRNCVRDWLEALEWDGAARIDTFLTTHFGAENTVYTRAASKNFWIAMVARVYRPGCQVDNMLVLDGLQGIGKSSALRAIGGEWFAEQHESPTNKDFYQILQGKLLVEISEMDSFSRVDITKIKQVVTCTTDRFRESYGRRAADHPRQCVFVGTSNKWSHDDETGARRFWPIDCRGTVDVAAIAAERPQLFAEAVTRFKAGESWWEMPAEETLAQQQGRFNVPALAEPIQHYINHDRFEIPGGGVEWQPRFEPLTRMTMAELLKALDVPKAQWSGAEKVAAKALRSLGWDNKPVKDKESGKSIRCWRVKGSPEELRASG